MFEREIAINEFLVGSFSKIMSDLPEDSFYQHFPGHGHSPVWLLGHLALVGEMGQRSLGGSISPPKWLRLFGPGICRSDHAR